MEMGIGMQSVQSFMLTWTAMAAAMMTPSALPFVISFARRSARWPVPTFVLVTTYLFVWTAVGGAVFLVSGFVPPSLPAGLAAGIAIAFVGLYSFTPWKRIGQGRCIAMCERREPVVRRRARTAVWEGAIYGLNCVACSGGVMLALVIVGMSNIVWMAVGSGLVLLYKVAGRWPRRLDVALSAAFILVGAWLLAV